ncbi:MAG: POTRA domain-containing protein, partial [Cyanobacteria bacterium J06636_16]
MTRCWWTALIGLQSITWVGISVGVVQGATLGKYPSDSSEKSIDSVFASGAADSMATLASSTSYAKHTGLAKASVPPDEVQAPVAATATATATARSEPTTVAQVTLPPDLPEDFPEDEEFDDDDFEDPLQDIPRIPEAPPPEPEPLPTLPSPEELLGPDGVSPPDGSDIPFDADTFTVSRFEVVGSTVFSTAELAAVTEPFTNRPLTFTQLLEVRSAITQLYVEQGYITSGAFVPPQTFDDGGIAVIRVIEGGLEEIQIRGTRRLNPGYISSRIGVGASPPLNIDRLLERLQVLQLDPLIETISADLQSGTRPGVDLLVVDVTEAET